MSATHVVWFRRDLRVRDNDALASACRNGGGVIALYILEDEASGLRPLGDASRWWLHHSLDALGKDLAALGIPLVLRRGDAGIIVPQVARAADAGTVHCARVYEPHAQKLEDTVGKALEKKGSSLRVTAGNLLRPPGMLLNKEGRPYRVFTPYWNAWRSMPVAAEEAPAPRPLGRTAAAIDGDRLADWNLLPTKPDWAGGLREAWTPGESGARQRLSRFLDDAVGGYATARDFPAEAGTSRLSPHLHFGEISPAQIWRATMTQSGSEDAGLAFLRELCWRDFNHDLLAQFPDMPARNIDSRFDEFPWQVDPNALDAWRRGRTGYPIVDAGMRELWTTGWMHNRVRMIVASFLIKHLLIDWRTGENWFWDTLVDADLANNTANWQWVAGSGADAAPYFRIFNPTLQGEKFDPDGRYVRRWVPEIADRSGRALHHPAAEPAGLFEPGYPAGIVDHKAARRRALAAFDRIKG